MAPSYSEPLPAVAVSHGPLSGEVTDDSAVLWARGSVPGRLVFAVSESEDFSPAATRTETVPIDETTDLTGRALVGGLAPATTYHVAVRVEAGGERSAAAVGRFRTAPVSRAQAAVRFTFGSCYGGQEECRPPGTGWTVFERMDERGPDFFLLLGDAIYADGVCPSADGRNVPGAESLATNLDGFRARYRHHLEDPPYRAFLATTPVFPVWDDHEITNDFGGPELERVNPALFREGRQAYFEYWPLPGAADDPFRLYRAFAWGAHLEVFVLDTRSYRDDRAEWDTDPSTGAPKSLLGPEQLAWLRDALRTSEATWKVIATSVPLSYPTGGRAEIRGHDGWANAGRPTGYETELMSILHFIARNRIDNVVFVTGDTHHPFALGYDPDRDGATDFHEFGASPIHAGVSEPGSPDQTFNPQVLYAEGGTQCFGLIEVAEDGELRGALVDGDGAELYSIRLEPTVSGDE
jgi:alkaline phosphatase D